MLVPFTNLNISNVKAQEYDKYGDSAYSQYPTDDNKYQCRTGPFEGFFVSSVEFCKHVKFDDRKDNDRKDNNITGTQGSPGPQGFNGTDGEDGAQWPRGPQGPPGVNGTQGPKVKEDLTELKVYLGPLDLLMRQMHMLHGKIALLATWIYFSEQAKAWVQ